VWVKDVEVRRLELKVARCSLLVGYLSTVAVVASC
jgi:hypothetical protein